MAMDFYSNDLYPSMMMGGKETSTDVTPDSNDQVVLNEDETVSENADQNNSRKSSIFLAIALVVIIAFFMGVTD